MTKKNTIYYEELCSLGELMDRQYNLYDEGLCNAENTLNYFKYLRENNKLEICEQYLLDITRYHLYAHRSKLYDILNLAVKDKKDTLIDCMIELAPNLGKYISPKGAIIKPSFYSEEDTQYSNLLGHSPEE